MSNHIPISGSFLVPDGEKSTSVTFSTRRSFAAYKFVDEDAKCGFSKGLFNTLHLDGSSQDRFKVSSSSLFDLQDALNVATDNTSKSTTASKRSIKRMLVPSELWSTKQGLNMAHGEAHKTLLKEKRKLLKKY